MGMVSIPVHVAPPSYGGDSTFPIYYAKATDSNYAISCSTSYTGHVCSSWNPSTINVPDGASGSCTRDHHAILIEPDGREYEFGHFNNGRAWIGDCTPISGGGTLYVGHNGICTITAFANGGVCKGSGVASGMPVIDTLLNPQELLEGAVTHELSAAGNCPSNTWQWPAHQSDGKCPGVGIPEGGIVWLDLSFAQIDSLPGHYNWDRTILRYLHKYGLRIVDSTKKNPNVPWSYYSYDDKSATAPLWTSWFTEVSKECPTCKIRWGRGASHLWLPTAGLTQSNFHVLAPP
ncbi:MAG: hypothetical protein JO104_09375 [Candidatus Eremiobacteraeota bacterium]|nr:hypothetical protein [Candidatus Eremiobacteraeota bacterium]